VTARLADTGNVRLKETGSVYVTRAATHQYQEARGIAGPEEARRKLTEHLLDATQSSDGTWRVVLPVPRTYRFTPRAAPQEIVVRVAHEDGLAVVTSLVSARDY
jgi:hypothetical protein